MGTRRAVPPRACHFVIPHDSLSVLAMSHCPFRLDSPRSFPSWDQLGLCAQESAGSSVYDSEEMAAAAEEQLLNDSLEFRAQTAPATFADENGFPEQVARQYDEDAADDACETFFVRANALAGAHVRYFSPKKDVFCQLWPP